MKLGHLAALGLIVCWAPAWASTLPVGTIVEERYRDDDLAVVVPGRLEMVCGTGKEGPWHFAFAGFETKWQGPIELEVSGSGGYETHDVMSTAALSLDFGGKDGGWIERSMIGLGLIQKSRPAHPPGWGTGTKGKVVMRENLIEAGPAVKKVTIDPGKYAPAGWDGRLWIGLQLHNVGAGKRLMVRFVNRGPTSQAATAMAGDGELWQLLKKHQEDFLRYALGELLKDPSKGNEVGGVVPEMRPYAQQQVSASMGDGLANRIKRALGRIEKSPPGSEGFLNFAEGFFEWQHSERENRSIAARLNGFYQRWKEGGEFGKELGCIVRTAKNMEKVGLGDVETGKIVTSSVEPIRISAARREYEGFQVVLSPLPGASKHVTVNVSDLIGDGGVIGWSNINVNAVGYVRIYPGQERQRLAPDPLLMNGIPELVAGENQPVWITVHVPENMAAGDYRGTVTIRSDEGKSAAIPLIVRVRDFEIPKKINLRSSFWLFRDQIDRFYHLNEVGLDDYLKVVDFALEHRVNPIDVAEGYCEDLLNITVPPTTNPADGKPDAMTYGTVNPNPDWSKWDAYIDRMVAGGANTIHLGMSHHFGSFFKDKKDQSTPQQRQRVAQAVGMLVDHYKQKGVLDLHYLQLRDETSEPDSIRVYQEIHEKFPEAKLMLSVPSNEARPLLAIPCPQTPGLDKAWRDDVRSRGGEYWWYVCLSPEDPYANLFIFQSGAQHRALFWQTWSHHVDGLLYWGLNFWSGYEEKWPAEVHCQTTQVAQEKWPAVGAVKDHPGDGFSMYPGPGPGMPMSSIRLECMRDGEEDYEYFVLLDKLIAKAAREGKSGEMIRKARAAEDAARDLVADMTKYSRDARAYEDVRNRVADCIEELGK